MLSAKDVLPIEPEEVDEILAAFDECDTLGTGKLGPAHAALSGRYSFGVLKCLLAEQG